MATPFRKRVGQTVVQDVQLQLPRWCRAVDALAQAHKRNPEGVQLVEERDQVAEAPAGHHIESTPPRITEKLIERRTAISRAGHAFVDVLARQFPVTRVHIRA